MKASSPAPRFLELAASPFRAFELLYRAVGLTATEEEEVEDDNFGSSTGDEGGATAFNFGISLE